MPCSVTSGGNPMSEAEMDLHTIGGLREEAAAEGRPLKQLVSLRPEDQLTTAIRKLFHNRCSMAPVLTGPSTGAPLYLGPCSAGHALSLQCPSAFTATVQLQHAFLSMSIRAYTRRRCSNAQRTSEAGDLNSMPVLEWGIVVCVTGYLTVQRQTNSFLSSQYCCAGVRPPNLTPPGTPPLHSPKSREPSDNEVCSLLHIATISGVLGALMRHFRASLASLPLLGQAIGSLPIGTWSPDSALVRRELNGGQQVNSVPIYPASDVFSHKVCILLAL